MCRWMRRWRRQEVLREKLTGATYHPGGSKMEESMELTNYKQRLAWVQQKISHQRANEQARAVEQKKAPVTLGSLEEGVQFALLGSLPGNWCSFFSCF